MYDTLRPSHVRIGFFHHFPELPCIRIIILKIVIIRNLCPGIGGGSGSYFTKK